MAIERRRAALALACSIAVGGAQAAAEEIQVYLDDMKAPGAWGLDVHNNFVARGRRTPDYAGEQPPGRVLRVTPELTYGITPTLELGLYVLASRASAGRLDADGGKVRLKYIPAHDADVGGFWGLNLEVGRSALRVAEQPWNAQLKGIVGWRSGPWLLAANPNVDVSLSPGGGPVTAAVDVKLAYALDARTQWGLESYNELGPVRALTRRQGWQRQGRTLYAVLDRDFDGIDLNLGLGRGLTPDADRWTLKFIAGFAF